MQDKIYLDYASSTPLNDEVFQTYTHLLKNHYANSESLYDDGVKIKNMLDQSRKSVADFFGVKANEIIFTSGASESNNMAIKGIAMRHPQRKHIITSKIEHSSVMACMQQLEQLYNYQITYINVDQNGFYKLDELEKALENDAVLVALMIVNNEVGTIQDIETIKMLVNKYPKTYLLLDGVQALCKCSFSLKDVDFASFSAHKINGLKGSGILVKKENVEIEPLLIAGQQEYGFRGGTSNALEHIVMAKTIRLANDNYLKNDSHMHYIYDYLKSELSQIKCIEFNTPNDNTTYILNFSTDIKSEIMLNALNSCGIMVSALSTCHSKSVKSHVLEAMGYDNNRILTSIRVSLGYQTTKYEIDSFVNKLKEIIEKYA